MFTPKALAFQRLKSLQVCISHALVKRYTTKTNCPSLKPFYLAVHPDFLWQHPSKKEVNENSLKELNQFIANLENNVPPVGPSLLQFYLRTESSDADHPLVSVRLDGSSLNKTIENILSSCGLPFEAQDAPPQFVLPPNAEEESVSSKCLFYKKLPFLREETLKKRIAKATSLDLVTFLTDRSPKAHNLTQGVQATRKALFHQTQEMKECLKLKDIVWDNQWTCLQHRNAVDDLARLSKQYQLETDYLAGRKLVFGNETGLYLNGDISFGCCDSRRLWIELLQDIPKKNQVLFQIWKSEAEMADLLKGVKVVHQREKACSAVEKYLYWIQKLCYVLERSTDTPDLQTFSSPEALRVVIDITSTEMKVLNTGEVTICPQLSASEVVTFLNKHSEEACKNSEQFQSDCVKEVIIQEKCVRKYGLGFLSKDESLQPERMMKCCERLIESHQYLKTFLKNLHICVSPYYIGTEDGVLCIPWNWRSSKLNL